MRGSFAGLKSRILRDMPSVTSELPQLSGELFLTDGGLETDLIFHQGIDLPEFASFPLLETGEGIDLMRRYYDGYVRTALAHGTGFVFETPTWRANPDWGAKLGYSAEQLASLNRRAVELMIAIRDEHAPGDPRWIVSGCLGPRGDAYVPEFVMTPDEAQDYHGAQVMSLADAGAELITAMTLTNVPEAVGIVRAAEAAGKPSVISFTVETDGRLAEGTGLLEAIQLVDDQTGAAAAYFMINCAHPDHLASVLDPGSAAFARIRGLRANASRLSHAELDESEELDEGNPEELGSLYAEIRERFPEISVLGGCCGTDSRHVEAIALACVK
jgi:S-methylmethionine-dependent homocysteine/selenocysteine methylase